MKYVAVEGMELAPVEQDVELTGVVVETFPSPNVSIDGNAAYSGQISVKAASAAYSGYVAENLSFTLHPSSSYAKIDGESALLEGDTSATVTASGKNPSLVPQEMEFPVTLKVSSAGQDSTKAD